MKRIDCCTPEGLIPGNEHYAGIMNGQVLPLLDSIARKRTLTAGDGKELYTETFPADQSRGTVLILHGFTENVRKYAELIYSLLLNGFSVVSYDQRGHGRSWRDPEVRNLSVTHVDAMADYVEDLRMVVETLLKDSPRPWDLFAHSMGGAVAALYLEGEDAAFDRAVLCAPMIAPNTGGVPPLVGKAICGIAKILHRGKCHPFS